MKHPYSCEEIFSANKFVPVVVLNDASKAITLAKALLKANIRVMEVTLRTENAFNIIETISNEVPEMQIGAGTVLTSDQYYMAISHGAKFIVSPGLSKELVEVARDYDTPFLPGAVTPTEVITAINYGFKCLKFFPAESFNGLSTLKAYASVFSEVKFCPTGGISTANARDYLNLKNVIAVGCSFLAKEDLIAHNEFAKITELALEIQLI